MDKRRKIRQCGEIGDGGAHFLACNVKPLNEFEARTFLSLLEPNLLSRQLTIEKSNDFLNEIEEKDYLPPIF